MNRDELTLKKIGLFWLPLALTWLMMSVEGPFLTALIARLSDPKYNLAAFGVAFSFALIIEAPVIMMMSASTALVEFREDYYKLRDYTSILNGTITFFMLIGLFSPLFYIITEKIIELPHEIAYLTRISSILLIPWPAAIGYRRFYQGLLIRNGLTKKVAYGTAVRLGAMASTALILYVKGVTGAYMGAASLSAGVVAEAIFARAVANVTIKEIHKNSRKEGENLTFKKITDFYYPLALTSILSLGVNPVVTFFLGRSAYAVESLAVLPVVNSFIFLFRSIGLSLQEVIIAILARGNDNLTILKKFVKNIGKYLIVILALIIFTPAVTFWYKYVSGLNTQLINFALLPTRILAPLPLLTLLIAYQRSILVHIKRTSKIKWASIIEVILIVLSLFVFLLFFDLPGVIVAALAYITGRLAANIYLFPTQRDAELKIEPAV